MIKKIGSNKYGVVEYAISSVEDIADLPLGVAIGSTAVLINKDGIRTFALGEGEWVEYIDAEKYDKNKLAQDLLFCGFGNDGEKHDDLDDRLIAEFDEINERVNVGNYLVYNGYHIKADYSLEGLQRGMMLEGRTLQNVTPKTLTNTTKDSQGYFTSTAVEWDYLHKVSDNEPLLLKPNTEYTYIIEVVKNTFNTYLYFPSNEQSYFAENVSLVFAKPLQTGVFVIKRKTKSVFDDSLSYDHYIACEKTAIESGTFKLRILCLEGDYTETPLEELPFIEGIQSSGEEGVVSGKSCGKNLAKTLTEDNYVGKGYGEVVFKNNKCIAMDKTGRAGCFIMGKESIKVKPNTVYYTGLECEEGTAYLLQTNLIIGCFDINNNVITRDGTVNVSNNLVDYYNSSYVDVYKGFLPLTGHFKFVKFSNEVHSVKLMFRPATSDGTTTNTFKNIIFVETDEQPIYEPYKESTYSYILDEPLRSLPNGACDTIDLETGVLTRRVGKVVITENTGIVLNNAGTNYTQFVTYSSTFKGVSKVISSNIWCDTKPVFALNESNNGFWIYDGTTGVFQMTESINTVELMKEWLKNNPTTVYYELKEPTIHQLDQNRIYSFKDTTHVTSDNLIAPRITTNVLTNSNALISHLKGENLALANEVSTLSLRNRETQETNETQDHIIDASLCAVDELYMMYETTQEVEVMSADEEGSRMVDMYVAMVQRGLKTIDQVPVRYRERVREILAQLED